MTTLDNEPDVAVIRIIRTNEGTYTVHTVTQQGIDLSADWRTITAALTHATIVVQGSLSDHQ